MNRNLMINGNMDFWLDATSIASAGSGAYAATNFKYEKVGAVIHTLSRGTIDTDVPTPNIVSSATKRFLTGSRYTLGAQVTTLDASIAAGDYCTISGIIEGNNFRQLSGKDMVVQFWVKSNKVGTYCVGLQNGSANRCYVFEYTIEASNTWQFVWHRVRVPIQTVASGWDFGTGIGLKVVFVISSGSNFMTTPNQWNSASNKFATTNQVNGSDSTSNLHKIAQVAVLEASVPQPYPFSTQTEELDRLARYFEKSYDLEDMPAAVTNAGRFQMPVDTGGLANVNVRFRSVKRAAAPGVTLYSPSTGASANLYDETGAADVTAAASSVGQSGFVCISSGFTANSKCGGHWTADSRL